LLQVAVHGRTCRRIRGTQIDNENSGHWIMDIGYWLLVVGY
jgi:hypothetical protein